MRRSGPAADRIGCGLIGVAALFHGDAALAAPDPFALPPVAGPPDRRQGEFAPPTTLFAEARLDGVDQARAVQVRVIDGADHLRVADARRMGFDVAGGNEDFVALSALNLARFSFDARLGRLELVRRRTAADATLIDFRQRAAATDEGRALTAGVLDYDLSLRRAGGRTALSGMAGARISRAGVALSSTALVNIGRGAGRGVTRLDTAITLVDAARGTETRIGDFVSHAPTGDRSVRMAGLRHGTDFAIQPDLVTYPLPDFAGQVAVPSALDVIVNDRRVAGAEVEAGAFALRNVPVAAGRNQVGVVVRNAQGQEELRTLSFYNSPILLTPGLVQASAGAGFVRRGYGLRSNDYGPFAFGGTYRRGLSRVWTAEAGVEAAAGFMNLGMAHAATLGGWAQLSVETRMSALNRGTGRRGRGAMIGAGFESTGGPLSVTMAVREVSRGYRDLAAAVGDAPPSSSLSAGIGFDLRRFGRFQLVGIRQRRAAYRDGTVTVPRIESRYVAAGWRATVARRINLHTDVAWDPGRRRSATISVGLSMVLGGRTSAQVSAIRTAGRNDVQASVMRPDVRPGDVGYALSIGSGAIDRAAGALSWRGDWGRVEARAERVAGRAAASLNARGSLIAADGEIAMTNHSGGGFALVRTGAGAGIAVARSNLAIATTGRRGRAIVTELPAYVPVKVSIDPATVPIDAVVHRDAAVVCAPAGGGVLIDLSVERLSPVHARLLHPDGSDIAAGSAVRLMPGNGEAIVGFDGAVTWNGLDGTRELRVTLPSGEVCYFDVPATAPSRDPGGMDLGALRCVGSIRPMQMVRAANARTGGDVTAAGDGAAPEPVPAGVPGVRP